MYLVLNSSRREDLCCSCPSEAVPCLSCKANPHNYDAWFDYLRLVESDADPDAVREVYERAIANVPPIQEKRHWKRYIYLWINYALYEELEAKVRLTNAFIGLINILIGKFCVVIQAFSLYKQ